MRSITASHGMGEQNVEEMRRIFAGEAAHRASMERPRPGSIPAETAGSTTIRLSSHRGASTSLRSAFRCSSGRERRTGSLDGGEVEAQVLALPPSHPYLRLPLQFAASLGLRETEAAEAELGSPGRYALTFTLVQARRSF